MIENYNFKMFYNSMDDDLITEFYIPAMKASVRYDRISAYFDSKILKMYSQGIEELYINGGKIRFIFSSDIKDEDYELMKKGYDLKEEYSRKLLNSIREEDVNSDFSNLAYLISEDIVDIKIAFTKKGVFHDKFGLFRDKENNILYFRGSNNETASAILNNYESFETSIYYESEISEIKKMDNAVNTFEKIWNNEVEGVITIPIPNIVKNKLESFSTKSINYIYNSIDNAVIFDITSNDRFFLENNLDEKYLLLENSAIFKYKLKRFVEKVDNLRIYFKKISYITLQKIINEMIDLGNNYNFNAFVTPTLRDYIYNKDLFIDKRKNLGIAIKRKDELIIPDFENFKHVVDEQLYRELREPQLWDAYHIVKMIKSSNFSVPGAGKTSIVYGAFAYLSYMNKVDKIVMIGPKNSFSSWKKEFYENFKDKRDLYCLDIQQNNGLSKKNMLKYESKNKNLILVNYESAVNLVQELKDIINDKTLLVFDEVHRIKGVKGVRAKSVSEFSDFATYKVALTGTPIPNSYKDLYNVLNILYKDEYNTFFNYDIKTLDRAYNDSNLSEEINNVIYPFFCRTTKKDLSVPDPFDDDITSGYIEMNESEKKIIEIIYNTYNSNILLLYVRLLQASSNPLLVLEKVDSIDFEYTDEDYDENEIFFGIDKNEINLSTEDYNYIKNHGRTRKIDKAAELIREQTLNGEKIIAWGMFIKNLHLMKKRLEELGVSSMIISGEVPQNERDKIINDFELGYFDVLITNPHTLAESISLHKTSHHAFYFEFSFNLTHMIQSRDRIHRLGISEQERPSYTYMFLGSNEADFNTIDEKVYLRLKEKEAIMLDAVENAEIKLIETSYEDDIKEILGDFKMKKGW